MTEKESRLAAFCKRSGYEGAWLRRRPNISWLTDGADVHVDGSQATGIASLLWTPRRKVVLTSNIECLRLAEEEFGAGWEIREHPWWLDVRVPKGTFATDYPLDPFADLRASLTELELRRLRDLGRVTAEELSAVMKSIRPGQTEHEVAGAFVGRMRSMGITVPVMLVAADERIRRYRHPISTSMKARKTVLVAACPRQFGLTVAVTRLIHFARSLPRELRRRHDAVCRVDEALHAATAPGQRWCDILEIGQQVYRETGFAEEWKAHHQGGPMGYEGRDYFATPSEARRVVENQAVGWNPSITGTKSEDTILSSGEVLTGMGNWPSCGSRPDILCSPL